MNPVLVVILNILVVVGIIVIATMIFDIAFVVSFNVIFRKHQKAITILLNVKYDNVRNLYIFLEENGYQINEKTMELAAKIQKNDLNEPGTKSFENSMNNLTFLSNAVCTIVNKNVELRNDEEIKLFMDNIKTSDQQFRTVVTMYNADCLGYNYWISFWPTKFIWKLFKFKSRHLIDL